MYLDGFVVPVLNERLEEYRQLSELAGHVWREHGALDYVEAVADDVPEGKQTDFFRAVDRQPGETVVFSYILYHSREQRDAVMKKVMADPRLKKNMAEMPFDGKRMIFGGFTPIVDMRG